MITIALDEAGVFDALDRGVYDSATTMIGGIIFDDNGVDGELEFERARVESYYKAVIEKVNSDNNNRFKAEYPTSLHVSNDKSDKEKNKNVGRVKEAISTSLNEFLQQGTYEGKALKDLLGLDFRPRNGKYYISAVVKSSDGKNALVSDKVGSFFRDGIASNLYFHMASDTVEHFIFHNPMIPNVDKVSLDIATKASANIPKELQAEYDNQGHYGKKNYDRDNTKFYFLMTGDVYRTILTEQLLVSEKKNIQVESFYVRGINYKPQNEDFARRQTLMYLADSVCSYLTREIGNDDVLEVYRRAQELTGEHNLVFAYDEVDEYFKKACRAFDNGKYYDCLKNLYIITTLQSPEAQLYKENWVNYLINQIKNETSILLEQGKQPYVLNNAIIEMHNSCMTNLFDTKESEFILKVFEDIITTETTNKLIPRVIFYLNDIGVIINCHRGNAVGAEEYFKICEKYASSIDLEEYTRTRNRYANSLIDDCNYVRAIEVVRVTLDLLGGLYELSQEKLGRSKMQFGKIEFAKTLSLAGQIAAFIDSTDSSSYLKKSMELYGDDIANRRITQSYLLHYYISAGNKDAFCEEFKKYAAEKDSLEEQIKAIIKMGENGDVNPNYAFYLVLKGIYSFCSDEKIKEIWEIIMSYYGSFAVQKMHNHPWELILKYMSLLALKVGKVDFAQECFDKLDELFKEDGSDLVSDIAVYSKALLYKAFGDNQKADKEISKFSDAKDLSSLFKYMYI